MSPTSKEQLWTVKKINRSIFFNWIYFSKNLFKSGNTPPQVIRSASPAGTQETEQERSKAKKPPMGCSLKPTWLSEWLSIGFNFVIWMRNRLVYCLHRPPWPEEPSQANCLLVLLNKSKTKLLGAELFFSPWLSPSLHVVTWLLSNNVTRHSRLMVLSWGSSWSLGDIWQSLFGTS